MCSSVVRRPPARRHRCRRRAPAALGGAGMSCTQFDPIHLAVPTSKGTDLDRLPRDRNGYPVERRRMGDQLLVLHYVDIPAEDMSVVDGIPCTTPLRTVIDVATDVDAASLDLMVDDCLGRGMFTEDEALARLARADLLRHPGGPLVVAALARRFRS